MHIRETAHRVAVDIRGVHELESMVKLDCLPPLETASSEQRLESLLWCNVCTDDSSHGILRKIANQV